MQARARRAAAAPPPQAPDFQRLGRDGGHAVWTFHLMRCACACACARACACECDCACPRARARSHAFMHVCVCVCAFVSTNTPAHATVRTRCGYQHPKLKMQAYSEAIDQCRSAERKKGGIDEITPSAEKALPQTLRQRSGVVEQVREM